MQGGREHELSTFSLVSRPLNIVSACLGWYQDRKDRQLVEEAEDGPLPISLPAEWAQTSPSTAARAAFYRAVFTLPPLGGKIYNLYPHRTSSRPDDELLPSATSQGQLRQINYLGETAVLKEVYLYQMSVQGRLPDEFKYAALALILAHPYEYDWQEPFLEAEWGKVGPLIHDGEGTNCTLINPFWQVAGRTDFLASIFLLHAPLIEAIKSWPTQAKLKLPLDSLVQFRAEQKERERFLQEADFYQASALACHSEVGTAPKFIRKKLRSQLREHWRFLKTGVEALLATHQIEGAAQVLWFNPVPRPLWEGFEPRYEADWWLLQTELIKVEEARCKNQDILEDAGNLMKGVTKRVHDAIGLTRVLNQSGLSQQVETDS